MEPIINYGFKESPIRLIFNVGEHSIKTRNTIEEWNNNIYLEI